MSDLKISGWKLAEETLTRYGFGLTPYDLDCIVFTKDEDSGYQGFSTSQQKCFMEKESLGNFDMITLDKALDNVVMLQSKGLEDIEVSGPGVIDKEGCEKSYSITGSAHGKRYVIYINENDKYNDYVYIINPYQNSLPEIRAEFKIQKEMFEFISMWIRQNQDALEEEIF